MTHRTFRSLDEPPKLIGFSVRQWAALISGGLTLLGLVQLASLPTKAALTVAVFALGLPAALTYVSESGGLEIGTLLRDALRWRLAPKRLRAAAADAQARGAIVLIGEQPRGPRRRAIRRGGGSARRRGGLRRCG